MMKRGSGPSNEPRVAWALWVVFQAALLAAVPLAHTAVEARASAASHHVEAPTEHPCVPGHDEFMCQLCRVTVIHGPPDVLWAVRVLETETQPPALVQAHTSQHTFRLPDSRAPPAHL